MLRIALTTAAGGLIATTMFVPAQAASPYDGTWVVDVPAAGFIESTDSYTCSAQRLPVRIVNGSIQGQLQRVATATGDLVLEPGRGRNARPVQGTVGSDGAVSAHWENYHAVGRLGPETGVVTVQTQCGPLHATVTRITAANDTNTTEGAGSSLPPAQGR